MSKAMIHPEIWVLFHGAGDVLEPLNTFYTREQGLECIARLNPTVIEYDAVDGSEVYGYYTIFGIDIKYVLARFTRVMPQV